MTYTIKSKPEDFVVEEQIEIDLDDSGDYAYFWLWKKGHDTIWAVEKIASRLRLRSRDIGFAGAKDRHAVTRQVVSIKDPGRRVGEESLSDLKAPDISFEYIGRGKSPVSLGDLTGNRFEIVLRDCDSSPRVVSQFVNYFDEQRFSGTNRDVGKAIVLGEFKKACSLISAKSVELHLADKKSDYVGAIKALPLKTRMMLVHAYQSWLWNETVSQYLRAKHDCESVKYSLGELCFPKTEIDNFTVKIPGFGTELDSSETDNILKDILKKEGVALRDFVVRAMPELSAEGGVRDVVVAVSDCAVENVGDGAYMVKFFLPKGCYATMCVKQMMA
ncbi:tRNA pseudouridine(13) synthase TruD [Candidatus Woesearchaeota archaeon]|nr:tRNA pseudouridine(13) synthase TruD [Candidatus Woesearchaeota archaeon]